MIGELIAAGLGGMVAGSVTYAIAISPTLRGMRDGLAANSEARRILEQQRRDASNREALTYQRLQEVAAARDGLLREVEVLRGELETALKNDRRDSRGRFTKSTVVPFGSAIGKSTGGFGSR